MAENPKVLSIQSHVVSGYVGNKSATFPLQLLGFEVDAINSVQFCNHTGYKKVAGQILSEKDLDDLAGGLQQNGLDFYSHLLTGYIGAESFLRRVCSLVKHLKSVNPNLIYVCDPVMGDNGKMYVPDDLLPVYKNLVLPLADIITPNQFEVELLTDVKINNVDDAWKAVDVLHSKGCRTVVVSSTELGNEKYLLALASNKVGVLFSSFLTYCDSRQ
jgi:pyridoxine kinase